MSARGRVVAVTAAVALVFAALVVAVAATSGGEDGAAEAAAAPEPREGRPPLTLDLGLREDAEARDLRRALALYADGRPGAAARLFDRHRSLEAKIGSAFARWPDGAVDRTLQLAGLHPRRAVVQLHLGLALLWADRRGAEEAWREAAAVEPDTPYAVTAGDLLHPDFVRGLPAYLPPAEPPALAGAPAEQLATLRRRAERRTGPARERVAALHHYGVALQRLGHPVSASRVFERALRLAPGDPDALVADAVGRFDKERPAEAFSRLGPLAKRFPARATVRFHLGLLLLWSGEIAEAERQLRRAIAAEPGSRAAREAARYLARIEEARR